MTFVLITESIVFPHSQESAYCYLNKHLEAMAKDPANLDQLTSSLHVWPDFHGNRSPLADPSLKGMVSKKRHWPQDSACPHTTMDRAENASQALDKTLCFPLLQLKVLIFLTC